MFCTIFARVMITANKIKQQHKKTLADELNCLISFLHRANKKKCHKIAESIEYSTESLGKNGERKKE